MSSGKVVVVLASATVGGSLTSVIVITSGAVSSGVAPDGEVIDLDRDIEHRVGLKV